MADIMPTLLTLMGIGVPSSVEGIGLSSHALGKAGRDHDAAHMQGMGATAAWTDVQNGAPCVIMSTPTRFIIGTAGNCSSTIEKVLISLSLWSYTKLRVLHCKLPSGLAKIRKQPLDDDRQSRVTRIRWFFDTQGATAPERE